MKKKRTCPWCKKILTGDWQYEMHVQYKHYKSRYDKNQHIFVDGKAPS